jgi:hypothetical protein
MTSAIRVVVATKPIRMVLLDLFKFNGNNTGCVAR